MDPENRIVSASRAGDLIRETKAADAHFICHKASLKGQDVACRGHHDAMPCRLARMSAHYGLPVEEVSEADLSALPEQDEEDDY
jgi:hypothetical protein